MEIYADTPFLSSRTGETSEYRSPEGKSFGVFVLAGYAPDTALVRGLAELDEAGSLITDENRKTSVEGVYGAGDVCAKSLRQVVTATADGALAAASLEQYAAAMHRKINAQPL